MPALIELNPAQLWRGSSGTVAERVAEVAVALESTPQEQRSPLAARLLELWAARDVQAMAALLDAEPASQPYDAARTGARAGGFASRPPSAGEAAGQLAALADAVGRDVLPAALVPLTEPRALEVVLTAASPEARRQLLDAVLDLGFVPGPPSTQARRLRASLFAAWPLADEAVRAGLELQQGAHAQAAALYRVASVLGHAELGRLASECALLALLERGPSPVAGALSRALSRAPGDAWTRLSQALDGGAITPDLVRGLEAETELFGKYVGKIGTRRKDGTLELPARRGAGVDDLLALARRILPEQVTAAGARLRAARQVVRRGVRPPAEAAKRAERGAQAEAAIAMEALRRGLLGRGEDRLLSQAVYLDGDVRRRYGSATLRRLLGEAGALTRGRALLGLAGVTGVEPRAEYDLPGRNVDLGHKPSVAGAERALLHELGHHLEYASPDLQASARAWLSRRATAERPVPLSRLVPDAGYGPEERALPDHFVTPYVGRLYDDGGTEVLSTGLERFASGFSMADLYADDEEHFLLVLGALFA